MGATFYLDGGLSDFGADIDQVAFPPPDHYLTIGAGAFGIDAFAGEIDRFRIDGVALSPDQLDSVASSPKPPAATTLVDYQFNESSLPYSSAAAAPRPAWPSSQFMPEATSPAFVSDTPSGDAGDYALQFGTNQSVTVADPETALQLDTNNPSFTLQAWVKFGAQPNYVSQLFDHGGPGGAFACWLSSRHLCVDLQDFVSSSAIVPDDGGWHHITVVHDNGKELRFYVDGLIEDTVPYTNGVDFSQTGTNYCVLSCEPGAGLPYVGLLDRLRLTAGVLAPDQFDDAQAAHYLVSVVPYPGASAADPNSKVQAVLTNATGLLNTNSLLLSVDGQPATASVSGNANQQTVISYTPPRLFAARTTHTVKLTFQDLATPAHQYTKSWTFTVVDYPTLELGLGTKLGSGDATQPGFRYRLVQTVSATNMWSDSIGQAEMNLAGGLDPYTDPGLFVYHYTATTSGVPATLTYPTGADGSVVITNVINFNRSALDYGGSGDLGEFQQPQAPDQPIPGLPVSAATNDPAADFVTAEMLTYVEFPQAGYYRMGVNCDDDFRVSSATNQDYPVKVVRINSPATMVSNLFSLEAQFDPPLPQLADVGPITGNVVEAQPLDGSAPLTNPDAIKGNIALIDRGVNLFADKVGYAADAGAVGVIIADTNQPDDLIIVMTGGASGLNIPAVMVNYRAGHALHTALESGQTVNVTLQSHAFTTLGDQEIEGGYDDAFGFAVPAAGVYPLRLLWYHGTGAAYCEWFSLDPDGNKVLLNDPSHPGALKAFRARADVPLPPTNPTLHVNLNGEVLTFTWTGTGFKLQSTLTLSNPTWTDVANGGSSPATDQLSGTSKFYRLASP